MQKILVINNNIDDLISTKALLSSILENIEIITATSGKEGIIKASTEVPDVIVICMNFPEKTTLHTIETLKSKNIYSPPPILLIAGKNTTIDEKINGLNSGADSIISHPINIVELSAQIKALFRIKKLELQLKKEKENLKDILLDIHLVSNKIDDDKEYIKSIGNILRRMTDTSKFCIGFYNSLENIIDIPYHADPDFTFSHMPNSGNLMSKVIKSRKFKKYKKNLIDIYSQAGEANEYESKAKIWLGFPLITNSRLIGLMCFQNHEDENTFNDTQINNLNLISTTLSTVFEARIKTKELTKALEKAQQSEKLKNNFLSNISHEIRTPMNAVIGFASMLYDDMPMDEREEYINLIINNGELLLKTIDDIVDMAKIQSGEIKLNKIETDIDNLLKKIQEQYKIRSNTNIKLILDIPSKTKNTIIRTDPFRLNQIIENLLSNSIKFTNKGEIKFGYRMKGNEILEFFVKDTGIGIPSDKLDNIFDKFFQLEEGDVREFGGNGLGLSITKSLIEMLNGEITVESEINKGTIFRFTLPVDKEKFTLNGHKKKKSYLYDWSNKKILLVDDVYSNLEFLEILLRKSKAETILADNGKKALDIFMKNTDIDLIIMDLQMPVMDGYTATRLIKEINPNVPVIIQTAFTETSDKKLAFESGCDAYMEKPIKANSLLKKISELLS